MNSGGFQAGTLDVASTVFEYNSKLELMLTLAVVVGGMIGVFYVLIANAVRGRRGTEMK